MAGKRLRDGSDKELHQPNDKTMRRLPSFATVIKQAMMLNSLQNFSMVFEPLFRRVVQEEMERGLAHRTRFLPRSPRTEIQAIEESCLQLIFKKPLSIPIFTGTKIEDADGGPLEVLLVENKTGQRTPAALPSPIKLEIVVLDGDFRPDGGKWCGFEFANSIVKEREGRRPLIIGEVNVTLRDGSSCFINDLTFTDNSSWIRSRHFRIGARVVSCSYEGQRIKEAITEPFKVKDHRGEFYRKHYPPSLDDDVWRLERIGKDGIFHQRLRAVGIYTVQDFLKLFYVDSNRLRRILGMGMSDRMWEGTLNHAKTCMAGQKIYIYRGSQCNLLLNPICQVVGIIIENVMLSQEQLTVAQRAILKQMVQEAYNHWDMIEEVEEMMRSIHFNSPQTGQGTLTQQPWYSNGYQEFELEDFVEIEDHLRCCS